MTKYQNCLTYFSLLNDDVELVLFTNPKLNTLNHALKKCKFSFSGSSNSFCNCCLILFTLKVLFQTLCVATQTC